MKKAKSKKLSIWTYLSKYKLVIFTYIALSLLASGIQVFNTIVFASGIEFLTNGEWTKTFYALLIALATYIISNISYLLLNFLYQTYSLKIVSQINLDLSKRAFLLNSKTFNDHGTGTFTQRIVEDPEHIVGCLTDMVDIVTSLISISAMIIYIMTINVYISLLLIATIIIGGIIEMCRTKIRRKNRIAFSEEHEKINSLTTEIVRSEKDIKSLGLEEKLSEVSKSRYESYRKVRYKFSMTDAAFVNTRGMFTSIMEIGVLALGVYLRSHGLITLASFMIIYSNNRTDNFIWNIGRLANLFVDIKVSNERMFALFDENEFVTEKFGDREVKAKGKIEFKKVGFTYKEYTYKKIGKTANKEKILASEQKIFDNLSFKIMPNTTVAFVGKSGSGKSTILNLISKMYEADKGKVLIDGVDVKDFNKSSLRSTISLVNQFPYIFDMTIKENLLLAKKDATDDEISDAIEKAALDEFVSSLPNGINTRVGESGIKLSGGQKQRLAIARALLRKSAIILFDESTSSLDNFAQNDVKRSIDGLKGKSTIVIVAHRLSTIKDVDEIFFLDEGKIVDQGTFNELFERNEKFRAMFLAENI